MSSDTAENQRLEIAHVLFLDIVGYSKLLTSEQRERLADLNRIVRETGQFRAAEAEGKLVRLPTGDGMVLAFFTSPDAPVRCAVAIDRALHGRVDLPLRMGIHSGPVDLIDDVNEKTNLAGAGVNIAQRVMDCGDAGHILLSERAASDLAQYAEWKTQLHDLGEVEVKHGVKVGVASLYTSEVGNPAVPQKLKRQRHGRQRRTLLNAAAVAVLLLLAAGGFWFWQRQGGSREQAAAAAAAQRVKSVAVLPFENLSGGEENAVLVNGVHREVLSNLAKVADLRVISRTSVMRFKPGADRNLKEIGGQLDVQYVVEGALQRVGNKIRVTADLIDAGTDAQVWSESSDGEVSDVLRIQTEIAQRISKELGAKLSARESTALATRPTQDMAAFESYIRGRSLMETLTDEETFKENFERAVQLLEQAVARDPKFVAAYWALAEANTQLFRNSATQSVEYRDRAEAAIKEAQRLAPEAGETIHALSRLRYYGYNDFKGALALLEEAAKTLPNSADVTLTRALLYRRFGRWQESYAQFVRAIELNPQDPFAYSNAVSTATFLRWWDDAERLRERIVQVFPRLARNMRVERMMQLRLQGEAEAARKEALEMDIDVRQDFYPVFLEALWRRDLAEARRLVDEAAPFREIERDRWEGEVRLATLEHPGVSREVALAAEQDLETRLRKAPPTARGRLAVTLAAVEFVLGKKDEAIGRLEEYVAENPVSEDALANVGALRSLAYGYVFAGRYERAIETFAQLGGVPGGIAYGPLKDDPVLDPLRSDPRFPQMLEQAQKPFPRL